MDVEQNFAPPSATSGVDQFTPSLLNGVPVPVLMTVTVRFTLK